MKVSKKNASYVHGSQPHTAIMWINLGSPAHAKTGSVRRYLREFLSDTRVVELPRLLWSLLLNLVILPFRSSRSAEKYQKIWTEEGSPLVVISQQQTAALAQELAERQHAVSVHCAMRYGTPAIHATLDQIQATQHLSRLLILPAYPQYSATTSASVFDAVMQYFQKQRRIPDIRFVAHYHDHPAYIEALAARVRAYWEAHGKGEQLLLSFHGIPRQNLDRGDPYHCECYKTARLLQQELGLSAITVSFQSRFGRAQWLQPYTSETLQTLAQAGHESIDVFCPGFVADCLETLEEIAMENAELFQAAGGKTLRYIPCLNDSEPWIRGLADIAEMHLAGWPTFTNQTIAEQVRAETATSKAQALQLGATA